MGSWMAVRVESVWPIPAACTPQRPLPHYTPRSLTMSSIVPLTIYAFTASQVCTAWASAAACLPAFLPAIRESRPSL